jgi:hypothetical protein
VPRRSDETYSERETLERREAALKRMLATPHKPHAESKVGKAKVSRAKSPGARKRKSQAKNSA